MLSIKQGTLYLHLAQIRKKFGIHNVIGLLNYFYFGTNSDITLYGMTLTPRGRQVFKHILEGKTDKVIAQRLGISYSGVRRHKEKMIMANNCNSILELISKYYELQDRIGYNK